MLPLRNSVLFPMSVVPINVGRPRSVRLVEELSGRDSALVGVITQKNAETVEPTFEDLYSVGTIARVVKVIRLGPSNYSVVLNGVGRFHLAEPLGLEPYMRAGIERVAEPGEPDEELRKLGQKLRERTRQVLGLMPNLPKETAGILDNVREPGALADLIASNFPEEQASIATRQQVLEAFDVKKRVELVLAMVERQLEVLRVKGEISTMVQDEMSRSQRDYVLRQQMRSIREELGEAAEDDEIEKLRERVARAELPIEADKAARKQLSRLSNMQPQSAEYQVTRTYVEWLADLPWSRTTPDRFDVKAVRRCLDEDHFGLERVKRRIVEYSAIRQLRRDKKGPILLFVGPPGVGKTSLGRSIARAMGRRYARISLGGVRDEAEIRGHRRTYVGALPGRIIQALKKVGTKNPVLVLDEVDKMGADVRGDPAAALLEVLDPEQNDAFVDHYIGLPFDLSEVTFLATANYRQHIPEALKDRMELIEVPGYTRTDKRNIAQQFLVPKQLKEHVLGEEQLEFMNEGVEAIIDFYTREAGVRGLEREIASVCRDATVRIAEGQERPGREGRSRARGRRAGHPPLPSGGGRARAGAGRGDGARRDARRRRPAAGGSHAHAGQGRDHRDRQSARGDEGIGGDGALVRALARRCPVARSRVAQIDRPASAHPARRRVARCGQRWRGDVRGRGHAAARCLGACRRGDDRRDDPARQHPSGVRHQGQDPRRPPGGHPRGRAASPERARAGRGP